MTAREEQLRAALHADPALCGRYSPHGHPRWWRNPPCQQIATRLVRLTPHPDTSPAEAEDHGRCPCRGFGSLKTVAADTSPSDAAPSFVCRHCGREEEPDLPSECPSCKMPTDWLRPRRRQ